MTCWMVWSPDRLTPLEALGLGEREAQLPLDRVRVLIALRR
jgi:hypothetical protein